MTRRKVAGMEVAFLSGLLFSWLNSSSNSFCKSLAWPFFSAASNGCCLVGFNPLLSFDFQPWHGPEGGFNTTFGRHETNRSFGVGARQILANDTGLRQAACPISAVPRVSADSDLAS